MEKGRQKITQNPSCGRIILNSTFTLCESQILLNIETRGKQKETKHYSLSKVIVSIILKLNVKSD